MSLSSSIASRLALPLIAAPMLRVSGVDAVLPAADLIDRIAAGYREARLATIRMLTAAGVSA